MGHSSSTYVAPSALSSSSSYVCKQLDSQDHLSLRSPCIIIHPFHHLLGNLIRRGFVEQMERSGTAWDLHNWTFQSWHLAWKEFTRRSEWIGKCFNGSRILDRSQGGIESDRDCPTGTTLLLTHLPKSIAFKLRLGDMKTIDIYYIDCYIMISINLVF